MNALVSIDIKPAGLPGRQRVDVRRGMTVEEIVLASYGSLDGIEAWLQYPGGGEVYRALPSEQWRHVRPKADGALCLSYRPHGGGKGNLFAYIAAIAFTVIAPYATAAILGTAFAVGTLAGTLVSTALVVGGSLLLTKLFPTAQEFGALNGQSAARESVSYSDVTSDANVLAKGAYLPWVLGARRIAPPDLCYPRASLVEGIQTIERCLGLYGKHAISDIWVDGTPVDSIPQITVQVIDGDEASANQGLVEKVSAPVNVSEQLSTFSLDGTELEDQKDAARRHDEGDDNASNSEPRWHYFSTPLIANLEEIAIRLRFDGFAKSDSATQKLRVPFQIQFRAKGAGTWNSLPEIHYIGRNANVFVRDLRIRWDTKFGPLDVDGEMTQAFWVEVPPADNGLSDGSTGNQWEADEHFVNGSGYRNAHNISGFRFGTRIDLDEATYPKAAYEWRIRRGVAVNDTALDDDYEISGVCHSLYLAYDATNVWSVPVDQGAFLVQMSVVQATVIANDRPTTWPEAAQIHLISKGQSIRNVTCEAAAYLLDWNGSAWASETAASVNPATLYYNALLEYCEAFDVNVDRIDSAQIVKWRQECIDQGYECSALFAGESTLEALATIAEAGFARVVISDRFSVDYFKDRSGENPVQVLGLRNTESARCTLSWPERPVGYRVQFKNAANDYADDEIEVTIDNSADVALVEALNFKGIVDETLVRRRAYLELLQALYRRRVWKASCAIEGVVAEIGDMVSLVSDLIDDKSQSVRVLQALDASTLRLDQSLPVSAAVGWGDSPSVDQIFSVGDQPVLFVSTPYGAQARTISAIDGNIVTLASPLVDDASPTPAALIGDDLASITGQAANIVALSEARHRCIVTNIEREGQERAVLTLVDESPEIMEEMVRKFG